MGHWHPEMTLVSQRGSVNFEEESDRLTGTGSVLFRFEASGLETSTTEDVYKRQTHDRECCGYEAQAVDDRAEVQDALQIERGEIHVRHDDRSHYEHRAVGGPSASTREDVEGHHW